MPAIPSTQETTVSNFTPSPPLPCSSPRLSAASPPPTPLPFSLPLEELLLQYSFKQQSQADNVDMCMHVYAYICIVSEEERGVRVIDKGAYVSQIYWVQ
jgi:hypothetical protein